jgi:hypothetical protein
MSINNFHITCIVIHMASLQLVQINTNTGKQLICTDKLFKSQKFYICQCSVFFNLEAKTEHVSNGKHAFRKICRLHRNNFWK